MIKKNIEFTKIINMEVLTDEEGFTLDKLFNKEVIGDLKFEEQLDPVVTKLLEESVNRLLELTENGSAPIINGDQINELISVVNHIFKDVEMTVDKGAVAGYVLSFVINQIVSIVPSLLQHRRYKQALEKTRLHGNSTVN